MKQKFIIQLNKDKKELLLEEYSQLERESYSLVCRESYDIEEVKKLVKQKDINSLIEFIRTDNFFPVYEFIKVIAENVMKYVKSKVEEQEPKELFLDDLDFIKKEIVEEEEKIDDIEDSLLLEDEMDTADIPKKILSINSSKNDDDD